MSVQYSLLDHVITLYYVCAAFFRLPRPPALKVYPRQRLSSICPTWITIATTHLGYLPSNKTSSKDLLSSISRSLSLGDLIPLSGLNSTSTLARSSFSIRGTLAGAGPYTAARTEEFPCDQGNLNGVQQRRKFLCTSQQERVLSVGQYWITA